MKNHLLLSVFLLLSCAAPQTTVFHDLKTDFPTVEHLEEVTEYSGFEVLGGLQSFVVKDSLLFMNISRNTTTLCQYINLKENSIHNFVKIGRAKNEMLWSEKILPRGEDSLQVIGPEIKSFAINDILTLNSGDLIPSVRTFPDSISANTYQIIDDQTIFGTGSIVEKPNHHYFLSKNNEFNFFNEYNKERYEANVAIKNEDLDVINHVVISNNTIDNQVITGSINGIQLDLINLNKSEIENYRYYETIKYEHRKNPNGSVAWLNKSDNLVLNVEISDKFIYAIVRAVSSEETTKEDPEASINEYGEFIKITMKDHLLVFDRNFTPLKCFKVETGVHFISPKCDYLYTMATNFIGESVKLIKYKLSL